MRFLVNLFLVMFLADGGISLADELFSLFAATTPLSGIRNFLADTVVVTAVLLYFCLGVDRRPPKRVLVPLIAFVLLCPLSTWFFPALSEVRGYGTLLATGQVLLFVAFILRFGKGERSLLLPKTLFDVPFFSLKNTLVFSAVNLFVIPAVSSLLILHAANSFLEEYTSGFVRLAPDGLHMIERVYWRDNRTIRLAAMIHIGEQEYFDELSRSVTPGRTVVLAEGVTDDDNLLRNRFDYGKLAGFLGLASQEKMMFRGRHIEPDELDVPRSERDSGGKPELPDILRADVDVSSFRPPTLRLLDELGRQLKVNPSPLKGLFSFNAWAEQNITPEMNAVILDDILFRRNKEVIRHLGEALERYDTIVIPWGALHMAEIEEEVLDRGFELHHERERVSIDFGRMIRGRVR